MSFKKSVRNMLVGVMAPMADFSPGDKQRARVIALHDIPEELRDEFARKMDWLKANYNMISLDDLFDPGKMSKDRPNIALTFDDGFKEFSTFAAPILRRLAIPAAFFISSGGVGAPREFAIKNLKRQGNNTFEFMNEEDVKSLSTEPLFTIGGHTKNHTNLGQELSETELEEEIVQDKKDIEQIIGKHINFFAYPFGSFRNLHKNSEELIRKAGYKAAFTIIPSFWSMRANPFRAGRDSLLLDDKADLWRAFLRGGYDSISKLKNYI